MGKLEFESVIEVPPGDLDAAFRFYEERGFRVTADDAHCLLVGCGDADELIRRVTAAKKRRK